MRKILLLPLLLLICLLTPFTAYSIDVYIDGQALQMDTPPQSIQGRTMVPIRAIFEAMGATVNWNPDTQTATGTKGNTTVMLKVGSLTPSINSQPKTIDVPAMIVNGRILAPLRFVGEAFGGSVYWDGTTQTVYITSPGTHTQQIKVHFIDVGQADSVYIELPNNNDILIDAGNRGDGDTVVDYLKAQGVDDIELVIATHPHEDHIGGLPDVYDAFEVQQTIDSGYYTNSQISTVFKQTATSKGKYEADNYQQFTFGSIILDILTGNQTWEDVNDYSVVCRLDTGDIEFLFTGDAETAAENALTGDLSSEILKVGHHGSNSSTCTSFLSKVNPEMAIISCGFGNSYGHPHKETLDKLNAIGATVYRTDLTGTIIVTSDGYTYTVSTEKGTAIVTPPTTTKAAPASQGNYVGSIKSDKYHLPNCRYAVSILPENQIWFRTEKEANANGYEPCGVCKP